MKTSIQPSNHTPLVINQFVAHIGLQEFDLHSLALLQDRAKHLSEKLNLHIVQESHYQFEPFGITYVCILSQSHLIFHTWPEHRMLHIDLMTCSGDQTEETFRKALEETFTRHILTLSLVRVEQ